MRCCPVCGAMFEGRVCPDCTRSQANTSAREKLNRWEAYSYCVQLLTGMLFAVPAGIGVLEYYGIVREGTHQGVGMLAFVYGTILMPFLVVAHLFGWVMLLWRRRSAMLRVTLW